jgi:hypothetical protein
MSCSSFVGLFAVLNIVFAPSITVAADHNSSIHFQESFSGEKVTVFVRRNGGMERVFSKRLKTEPDIGLAAVIPVNLEPNGSMQITCINHAGKRASIECGVPQSIPKYCFVRFEDGKLFVKWTSKKPLYD